MSQAIYPKRREPPARLGCARQDRRARAGGRREGKAAASPAADPATGTRPAAKAARGGTGLYFGERPAPGTGGAHACRLLAALPFSPRQKLCAGEAAEWEGGRGDGAVPGGRRGGGGGGKPVPVPERGAEARPAGAVAPPGTACPPGAGRPCP